MTARKTQIENILEKIRYKNWKFRVEAMGREGHYIQLNFVADGSPQTARKWYISRFATESEIVQTALKAVLTAEEHETRERFLFRGVAIFGPHLDVNRLADHVRVGSEVQEKRA